MSDGADLYHYHHNAGTLFSSVRYQKKNTSSSYLPAEETAATSHCSELKDCP
jgi:hypothetical protein